MNYSPVTNIIQSLHDKAQKLSDTNMADDEIIKELVKEGIDRHYAATVLDNVRNARHDKKEFKKHILMGSFVIIAGLLINYLSYNFPNKQARIHSW